MNGTLVIGIGNPTRGDDAVGREVVNRLRGVSSAIAVREEAAEAAALMEAWQGWDRVILVDAAAADAAPGTVRRFEAHRRPLPASLFKGTKQGAGVDRAIELSRALGLLPKSLVVFTVQAQDLAAGHGLSPAVTAAIGGLVKQVWEEAAAVPQEA